MRRQLIAVIVVVAALSASIGYGLGSATSPQAADAASASQNTAIVDQLKAINSKLGRTQTSKGSVRGLLSIICDYTASIDCTP
jgi:type II secretory pathway pseudopilin PulG